MVHKKRFISWTRTHKSNVKQKILLLDYSI